MGYEGERKYYINAGFWLWGRFELLYSGRQAVIYIGIRN